MYPRTRKPSGEIPFNGSTTTNSAGSITLRPILPIILKANGRSVSTFALLDTGSEVTLVKNAIIDCLGISGRKETMEIETVSGRGRPVKTRRVDFDAESLDRAHKFQIEEARAVDSFNLTRRSVNVPNLLKKWPHLDDVPFHSSDVDEVSIIIGQDHPAALEVYESRSDPSHQRAPRALSTAFGWCIVGPLFDPDERQVTRDYLKTDDEMAANGDFVQSDTFGTKPGVAVSAILVEKTKHNESGLLRKTDDINIENNYSMVLNRLLLPERKFFNDPSFAARFQKVMEEHVRLNHARKLSAQEIDEFPSGRVFHNPYHAVVDSNKTEKGRIAFDPAAEFKRGGIDATLLKGPDLQCIFIGILLRFGQYAVPLVADEQKKFQQVPVIASDGPASRYRSAEPPVCVLQKNFPVYSIPLSDISLVLTSTEYTLQQAVKNCGDGAEDVTACIEYHFFKDYGLRYLKTLRGTWPLEKVIEIYAADDGVARSAPVKTRGTELLRPAHNLCLLESVDGPGEDDDVDGVLDPAEHRAGNVTKRESFGLQAKVKRNGG